MKESRIGDEYRKASQTKYIRLRDGTLISRIMKVLANEVRLPEFF